MLLQRKSLAFVALSGEKYLIVMLLKVGEQKVFSRAKNYQNYLRRVLLRRKKLHWPRLIWSTSYSYTAHTTAKTLTHVIVSTPHLVVRWLVLWM